MQAKPAVYQPKGSMCLSCRHLERDCSHLRFESMPTLKDDWPKAASHVVIVRCTEFERRRG